MARGSFLSRDSIKALAGNDGNYKRGLEVQASKKMTEVAFSGDMLIHGKAKCGGSSPSDNYLLKFEIDPELPGTRPQADCSCPAAQRGICKHIIALLLLRADRVAANERLKASERLAAGRAEASGKAVLACEAPPPPPEELVKATPSSEVEAVFRPSITNALAAGSALSKDGGPSSGVATKRILPPWMQPKPKPEKAKAEKKGRASVSGSADIRTLLTPKKRPLEVVAKPPPKRRARKTEVAQASSNDEQGEDDAMDDVAPRQHSTRRSGQAANQLSSDANNELGRAEPEANEKGQQKEAEVVNTLGDGWGTFLLGKHEEYEEQARKVAATSQSDARESEALWDGEDDSQAPSQVQLRGRGSRSAAQVPTESVRRRSRNIALDKESKDRDGARPRRKGSQEADKGTHVGDSVARQTESHESGREVRNEPSQEPNAPPKKLSVYSLKSWKVDLSDLNDDEARQLHCALSEPRASLPSEPPLAYPEASLRQVESPPPVSKADDPQDGFHNASVSEVDESRGNNLGSLPELSDAAEESAEHESDQEQDALEGQSVSNPFEALFGMQTFIKQASAKGRKKSKTSTTVPKKVPLTGKSDVIKPQDSTHVHTDTVPDRVAPRFVANNVGKATEDSPSKSIRPVHVNSVRRPSAVSSAEPSMEKATSRLPVGPAKKKIRYGDLAAMALEV